MKNRIILICSLIIAIVVISFLPVFNNGFTNWDDDEYVIKNTRLKDFSLGNIKKIFSSYFAGNYHPLTLLSYSIEYYFFKLNPVSYHTVNLVLHVFNCLFVFWLIYLISGKLIVSFVTTLLFGIHPLHVESVAWIAERKDVLYSFFFLSAFIGYLYYVRENSIKFYYISFCMFVLSVLSKGMAITFPLLLFLSDYLLGRKFNKKIILEKIPFMIVSVLFLIVGIIAQYSSSAVPKGYLSLNGLLLGGYGIGFYIMKILVPVKLSCFYHYPVSLSGLFPLVLLCVVCIVLLIVFGRNTRKVIFGSLFFLISVLPVMQLIPLGGGVPADRYTYIPSIGLFFIIGEGIGYIYNRKFKVLTLSVLVVITVVLSFLTFERAKVWKDSFSLWEDVLTKYPNSVKALNGLGIAYSKRGENERAILHYSKAIQLNPDFIEVYNNRGIAYANNGEFDKALVDYNKVVKINPNYAEVYANT